MISPGDTSDPHEFSARIRANLEQGPSVHHSAYVAKSAVVVGHVEVGENGSLWPMATARGDIAPIYIGRNSNVQDSAVLHVADDMPCRIGENCTIGHSAIVHACTVENECLIGMGAIVLDGAVIGTQSIVGAGALVTQHTKIPPGSLVLGSPAKVVRQLSDQERKSIRSWADRYVIVSREHKARG